MTIFRLFERPFSIVLKGIFFLEYHKTHFPGAFCLLKKKMEKLLIFDQNHGLTLFKNSQFVDFFKTSLLRLSCVNSETYNLQRVFRPEGYSLIWSI